MNQRETEEILQEYAASLGRSGRLPTPARPRFPWRLVATAAAIATVVVMAGWPKEAAASKAYKEVLQALTNVKTMELRHYFKRKRGWEEFLRTYYQNGRWRHETRRGSPLEGTYILRGPRVLSEYGTLDHAVLGDFDAMQWAGQLGSVDALEYVRNEIDQGAVSDEHHYSIRPHDPVDGKPSYTLHIEHENDGYKCDLVVLRGSNLPVSAESQLGLGPTKNRYRLECRFDEPLPDSLFDLKSSKPIVDLNVAWKELAEQWSQPLLKVDNCNVRAAEVTPDGTVWIACSFAGDRGFTPEIDRLKTAFSDGYERLAQFSPSGTMTKEHTFELNGEHVEVAVFVPLHPVQELPREARFRLKVPSEASPKNPYEPTYRFLPESRISLTRQPTEMPGWWTALDLDWDGLFLHGRIRETRAQGLKRTGQTLQAAHEFEAAAQEQLCRYSGASVSPLRMAAACYRELGMASDATRCERAAQAIVDR